MVYFFQELIGDALLEAEDIFLVIPLSLKMIRPIWLPKAGLGLGLGGMIRKVCKGARPILQQHPFRVVDKQTADDPLVKSSDSFIFILMMSGSVIGFRQSRTKRGCSLRIPRGHPVGMSDGKYHRK
jgi:hypothetical protein